MDEDLNQFEAELLALQPAAPRRDLVARIEAELASTPASASTPVAPAVEPAPAPAIVHRPSRQWWFYAGASLAAAAIILTLLVIPRRTAPLAAHSGGLVLSAPTKPVAPEPVEDNGQTELAVFKPVASENVLYAVKDEGFVTLDDGTAARRERLNYVDTITWKNPRTNASVKWTVPREEVRVVPVKFQ